MGVVREGDGGLKGRGARGRADCGAVGAWCQGWEDQGGGVRGGHGDREVTLADESQRSASSDGGP